MRVDNAILDTNKVICKNINIFDSSDRGLLSQNILAQLRNFVEYIAIKVYSKGNDVDPNDYDLRVRALESVKSQGKFRFLNKFHDLLQKSASHYTLDEDSSERLMLKYYEYLLKVKTFLFDTYGMCVLDNIDEFPLDTDTELIDYYKKIAEKINNPSQYYTNNSYIDRYYIQKIKPFFVDHKIYYEVTLTVANNKTSKFDRVIAFTKYDLSPNYAVKLSIRNDSITIINKKMNIQVIDDWSVSIRPCELNNFADILGPHPEIKTGSKEYNELMIFLTKTQITLSELILCTDSYYEFVRAKIVGQGWVSHIFNILDKCRKLVVTNAPGSNVIIYLLYNLNNTIIKRQRRADPCPLLSSLHLNYGCIPFDKMPFCTSLIEHNPKIYDLLECIPPKGREHEFFSRRIKNNTEIDGILFTHRKELSEFTEVDTLIQKYNGNLYLPRHDHRMLMTFHDYIYIKGYVDDSEFIIKKLRDLTTSGLAQYAYSVDSWLNQTSYVIDSPEKSDIMHKLFDKSHLAIIYGSAGTGKSTLINHIANFFSTHKKFFLANTHPAVDNLRRRVSAANSEFYTIASFISTRNTNTDCDILIIDECSTVSNADMRKILKKASYKLVVLVGDIYQIESIYFGNWFDIARNFVSKDAIFELKHPYRTQNNNLLTVWERVRNLDIAILEPLVKNKYSMRLDESIFDSAKKDEIVLCLNYDGLYGINNINRFLQGNNPNPSFQWGIGIYKVGDPILFNESNRFAPLIHNNSKGYIVDINIKHNMIWFDVELDCSINEMDAWNYDFELIGIAENGNSIIRFAVSKYKSTDEDDDQYDALVPFQVAYAVSIHKAQGLEYRYVKIVITNEAEERISHNIFYTAITRAKEELKIYWSPETEKRVLEKMTLKNSNRDTNLLTKLKSL